MSYGRDRDAATRGVGAIASRDMVHPRKAIARARARARFLQERDRALSHLTYGTRGGLSLGAMSTKSAGMLDSMTRPTLKYGGGLEVPPLGPYGGPVVSPLPPTIQPPKPGAVVLPPFTGGTSSGGGKPGYVTGGAIRNPVYTPAPPMVIVDPVHGTTTTVTTTTNGGVGVKTGGDSSSSTPSLPDVPELPDAETPEDADDAVVAPNTKKYLLWGGIAVGAYLLWRNRK